MVVDVDESDCCWSCSCAVLGSEVGGFVVEERGSVEEDCCASWCGLLCEASFDSSFDCWGGLEASWEDEGGGLVE